MTNDSARKDGPTPRRWLRKASSKHEQQTTRLFTVIEGDTYYTDENEFVLASDYDRLTAENARLVAERDTASDLTSGRFEQLFLAVCNAEFACGEYGGGEDESYDQLSRTANVASRALRSHYFGVVRALTQAQAELSRLSAREKVLEAAVRQWASECGECNGTGVVQDFLESHGQRGGAYPGKDKPCDQCEDIRAYLSPTTAASQQGRNTTVIRMEVLRACLEYAIDGKKFPIDEPFNTYIREAYAALTTSFGQPCKGEQS